MVSASSAGSYHYRAAEEVESVVLGGNKLVLTGARVEKIAKLIMTPEEPGG